MPRRPAGTGSVVAYHGKRGTVYRISYRDADGRQQMETIGPDPKAAEAALRDRLTKKEGGWRRPAPTTFHDYAHDWLDRNETKRAWRPHTRATYRSVHRRLLDWFGPMPLATIRPRHVAEYVDELGRADFAASTITRDLALLSSILEGALREERIDTNPARRAERPRQPERRWKLLTPDEVRRVDRAFLEAQEASDGLDAAYARTCRAVFLTAVALGLRRNELLEATWADVDLIENRLRVAHSKSRAGERSLAIPPRLAQTLWEHLTASRYQAPTDRVFCHPHRGGRLDHERYAQAYRDALTRAGIDPEGRRPFHDARHLSLTLGAAAGENAVQLMTRAGHASMATTRVYLDLAGTVFPDAARALEERLHGGSSNEPSNTLASPDVI